MKGQLASPPDPGCAAAGVAPARAPAPTRARRERRDGCTRPAGSQHQAAPDRQPAGSPGAAGRGPRARAAPGAGRFVRGASAHGCHRSGHGRRRAGSRRGAWGGCLTPHLSRIGSGSENVRKSAEFGDFRRSMKEAPAADDASPGRPAARQAPRAAGEQQVHRDQRFRAFGDGRRARRQPSPCGCGEYAARPAGRSLRGAGVALRTRPGRVGRGTSLAVGSSRERFLPGTTSGIEETAR